MAKVVMNDEWSICDVWDVHAIVIGFTTCMSMSMTTGRSHRSCLYSFIWPACHQETPCKLLYFIAKRVSHSGRNNSWRATSWRHDDGDHDDGDHGVKPVTRWSWSPKMEIKGAVWYWPYHVTFIIWLHVMFIMFYASCLLRTTVVNKMIPYKISRSVLP